MNIYIYTYIHTYIHIYIYIYTHIYIYIVSSRQGPTRVVGWPPKGATDKWGGATVRGPELPLFWDMMVPFWVLLGLFGVIIGSLLGL